MACRAAWDTPNLASVVLCLSRKCTCNLFCTILVSISLAPAHQHSTALSEEAPDESFNANLFVIVVGEPQSSCPRMLTMVVTAAFCKPVSSSNRWSLFTCGTFAQLVTSSFVLQLHIYIPPFFLAMPE